LVAKQERSMRRLYKSAVMLDGGGGVSLSPRWRFSSGAY
jgi:hypothetical protein